MQPIKILIVDDAVTFRHALKKVLGEADGVEVVGDARDGKLALEKIATLRPDVVVLDVEMPVMNGIEALRVIASKYPHIHVIMFSAHTTKAASMTIEALTLGAKGFVPKPHSGGISENLTVIEQELLPLIRELRGKHLDKPLSSRIGPGSGSFSAGNSERLSATSRDVICIGISTGGPNALKALLPELPANLPVPILIVQHMPPIFTRQLAERLDNYSKIKVVEAEEGMSVNPGTAYIAPGDYHMTVEIKNNKKQITLNQGPQECSCRPAVNPLFRSVAKIWGRNAVGVIMTGMGNDGMLGAEVLKGGGAVIIAQDMESSVVWGMPGAVVSRKLTDLVLPLNRIAGELTQLCARGGR